MDPDATLQAIQEATDPNEINELCRMLDGWLEGGGFEPHWHKYARATTRYRIWCTTEDRKVGRGGSKMIPFVQYYNSGSAPCLINVDDISYVATYSVREQDNPLSVIKIRNRECEIIVEGTVEDVRKSIELYAN